jgi:hypothetical protein
VSTQKNSFAKMASYVADATLAKAISHAIGRLTPALSASPVLSSYNCR